MGARVDFFISYPVADRAWAEWIAWQLKEARYATVLQAWDFRPGDNLWSAFAMRWTLPTAPWRWSRPPTWPRPTAPVKWTLTPSRST
jgi:TIR domain